MTHELPNGTNQLPDDWVSRTLGDVSTKPQYGWTTKSEPGNDRLHYLRTTDITKGPVNWSTVPRCVTEPSDTEKYLLKTGDIVVSRAGSVGCCALLGEVPPSVFASYLIRLRPLAPLNKTYVFWFLQSPAYWDAISEASVGIAVQNVNAKKLASIELPIPPLAEQGRIVEILDEHLGRLDTALEHIKIAREKAAQFRRSLLHAAFTGALTGHNPTTNQLPDGWVSKTLGDVSTKPQYGWTTKSEPGNDRLHYLRTTDITKGPVNWSTVPRCVTEPGDTERFLLKTGDIVVSRAGSVGCCALLGDVPPSVFASYLIRLRPLAPLNKTYVFWFLQSPAYWDAISEASAGIAVQNVNAKKLASIELPVPPPPSSIGSSRFLTNTSAALRSRLLWLMQSSSGRRRFAGRCCTRRLLAS